MDSFSNLHHINFKTVPLLKTLFVLMIQCRYTVLCMTKDKKAKWLCLIVKALKSLYKHCIVNELAYHVRRDCKLLHLLMQGCRCATRNSSFSTCSQNYVHYGLRITYNTFLHVVVFVLEPSDTMQSRKLTAQ